MIKIYFVGGTKRAVNLYKKIIDREDIYIVNSIFMKGYPDEFVYCEELCEIAKLNNLKYVVSDNITDEGNFGSNCAIFG